MSIRFPLSVLTSLLLLTLVSFVCGCDEPEQDTGPALQDRELRLALAGRGDPWSHLTPLSKPLLLALHEGVTPEDLQESFGIDEDSLMAEIHGLEEVGLLRPEGDSYLPDFFIANKEEAEAAYLHSRETGEFLARKILEWWPDLEAVYGGFAIQTDHSLHHLGFFLVGGRILDMGMLAALVDEGSMLEHAPSRPSPGWPDGRYYFWGVEGGPAFLGRYGENTASLGETKWSFATFGANFVEGRLNAPRNELEDRFQELLQIHPGESPEYFGRELSIPFLTQDESNRWALISQEVSEDLVHRLLEAGPDIPAFFRTLRSGAYARDRRPEFMVWYYHLAYAWAIDYLMEIGTMARPPDEFLSFILYLEDEGGVLKGF